jgi:hypothetical protein
MRGEGETTRRMLAAPADAIYVWCTQDRRYAVDLAHYLGRTDLKIVRPDPHSLQAAAAGSRRQVVVDHALFDCVSSRTWQEITDMADAYNGYLTAA